MWVLQLKSLFIKQTYSTPKTFSTLLRKIPGLIPKESTVYANGTAKITSHQDGLTWEARHPEPSCGISCPKRRIGIRFSCVSLRYARSRSRLSDSLPADSWCSTRRNLPTKHCNLQLFAANFIILNFCKLQKVTSGKYVANNFFIVYIKKFMISLQIQTIFRTLPVNLHIKIVFKFSVWICSKFVEESLQL